MGLAVLKLFGMQVSFLCEIAIFQMAMISDRVKAKPLF